MCCKLWPYFNGLALQVIKCIYALECVYIFWCIIILSMELWHNQWAFWTQSREDETSALLFVPAAADLISASEEWSLPYQKNSSDDLLVICNQAWQIGVSHQSLFGYRQYDMNNSQKRMTCNAHSSLLVFMTYNMLFYSCRTSTSRHLAVIHISLL